MPSYQAQHGLLMCRVLLLLFEVYLKITSMDFNLVEFHFLLCWLVASETKLWALANIVTLLTFRTSRSLQQICLVAVVVQKSCLLINTKKYEEEK